MERSITVGALLDFTDQAAFPDRMNRTGRNEKGIPLLNGDTVEQGKNGILFHLSLIHI